MKCFLFIVLWTLSVCAGATNRKKHVTVVFYNVENLFDIFDGPEIKDEEFLPGSSKKWTLERYHKKLEDIARVITDIDQEDLPEIVGFCEIENQTVLNDLVKSGKMATGNYQIVHIDSPDGRGMDVAFLYRKGEFKVLAYETLQVDPGFSTRDILHVYGKLGPDKVHFFVNHWPSRIGGLKKSQPGRIVAAKVLRQKVSQILAQDPFAKIVIMGDLNDEPLNESVLNMLGAKAPGSGADLVNLMLPLDEEKLGSYYYRGEWNMLDNLIVTGPLLKGKGFTTKAPGHIFHEKWMEYKNKEGDIIPNRTYGGPAYYGGVSDHFPVYLELTR